MKAPLIRIGRSKGIRIPDVFIEQLGLRDEVDVALEGKTLVIRPACNPREGWAEAFDEMARRGDDLLLDGDTTTEWDQTEWNW